MRPSPGMNHQAPRKQPPDTTPCPKEDPMRRITPLLAYTSHAPILNKYAMHHPLSLCTTFLSPYVTPCQGKHGDSSTLMQRDRGWCMGTWDDAWSWARTREGCYLKPAAQPALGLYPRSCQVGLGRKCSSELF